MLRISKLSDYGTVILTQMASQPAHLYSAAELAETLGLGVPTVSKVLKTLGRHALVTSLRGARGGYTLARPAHAITVADIIDALEEQPFGLTECSATSGSCDLETSCRVRANWVNISTVVRRALEDVSLAEMIEPVPPNINDGTYPIHGPDRRSKHTTA